MVKKQAQRYTAQDGKTYRSYRNSFWTVIDTFTTEEKALAFRTAWRAANKHLPHYFYITVHVKPYILKDGTKVWDVFWKYVI